MSFPKYPDCRDSGVEWIGAVPSHWALQPLRRHTRLLTEKTDRREHPVALENIESWTGRFVPTETEFQGEGVAFDRGDILFGKLRPYLAKALVAELSGEAVGDFLVMRPTEAANPRFLAYQLRSREFISIVDGSTFGSKMPRASWDFVGAMPSPLPPTKEQSAIATFLDRETAKIDVLVDEQKQLIELLKEKRQAVISQAVTQGLNRSVSLQATDVEWLGKIPAHWSVTRLANLFREVDERGNDSLPLLSVSIHDGVSDDELDESEMERKVTRSDDRSKYKKVLPGDLVYNMMRAWQGGFGSVTVEGMVSPAYVVARPKTDFPTWFIERLLRTPNAVEEMRGRSRGVTDFRLRLYWEEFKDIVVGLPPKAEADAIRVNVEAIEERIERTIEAAEDCIGILNERRTALISAAVTGKIDVRRSVGMVTVAA